MTTPRNRSIRSIAAVAIVLTAFNTSMLAKAISHQQPASFSTLRGGGLRPVAGGRFLLIPLAHGAKVVVIPLAKGSLRARTITLAWRSSELRQFMHITIWNFDEKREQ